MRLVLFYEFFNVGPAYQAPARRNQAFARVLSQCGADVLVLVPNGPYTFGHEHAGDGYAVKYIDSQATARQERSALAAALQLPSTARLVAREVRGFGGDALIVAAHLVQMSVEAALAARLAGVPLVVDFHDSWLVLSVTRPGDRLRTLKTWIDGAVARRAAAATAVSATHADLIAHGYRVPRHRISVVHNGVMHRAAPPVSGNEKAYDLIHLGAPRPYYDTPSLLQALAKTRDHGLQPLTAFLGCLEDDYTTEARRYAEELGLSDTVEFLAPVSWEEVPSMLARARVGLYSHCPDPIYDCALGVKLFEYMQAGLPVAALVGDESEAAKVVTACGCGLAASDPMSYAKGLADLLRSPDTVSAMGAAARGASRDFTWDEMIARFYQETLRPLAAG